ncbi:MAG TPA: glycosyltransferase family 4 protein [Solirubrobacteraceae bacterium]|nr:glycosyltransferase family 4 protein [Solirubrobacteraceae bacterium]
MSAIALGVPDRAEGVQTGGRLRVALVYDDSMDKFGGVPQYIGVLSAALRRAGHEVTLLVGHTAARQVSGCDVHSLARNVRVRFNGNVLSVPLIPQVGAIRSVMREQDFDVMHVQVPYSPLMAGQLIRQLPHRTALVGTFHVASERALPRLGARLLSAWTRRSRRRFDEMICVSRHAAAFARTTFGVRRFALVPNMVELDGDRADAEPSATPTVVCVGALVPRKGQCVLVDAFALVVQTLPDARLVLAGEGPQHKRLERRIAELGLASNVCLLGAVPTADRAQLLRTAHVACFPSSYGESFGIVLLEAMAAGSAVLAGRNAGYLEVLGNMSEALAEPRPRPLARALTTLLLDDSRRRRLIAQQHTLVQRFDANDVTAEILTVYRSALGRRHGAPVA